MTCGPPTPGRGVGPAPSGLPLLSFVDAAPNAPRGVFLFGAIGAPSPGCYWDDVESPPRDQRPRSRPLRSTGPGADEGGTFPRPNVVSTEGPLWPGAESPPRDQRPCTCPPGLKRGLDSASAPLDRTRGGRGCHLPTTQRRLDRRAPAARSGETSTGPAVLYVSALLVERSRLRVRFARQDQGRAGEARPPITDESCRKRVHTASQSTHKQAETSPPRTAVKAPWRAPTAAETSRPPRHDDAQGEATVPAAPGSSTSCTSAPR